MIDIRPIFFIIGILLTMLGIAMLVPAVVDMAAEDIDWKVFVTSAVVTGFVGMGLLLTFNGANFASLGTRASFLLTFLSWACVAAAASIPFLFSNLNLDAADAFFEAMSGITTTGSTVLTNLENVHRGILLWRSMLQWLGGIGIVVTAIALLPVLQVGGMQLFRAEFSDKDKKLLPSTGQLALAITSVFAALVGLCTLAYLFGGMSLLDARLGDGNLGAAAGLGDAGGEQRVQRGRADVEVARDRADGTCPCARWCALRYWTIAGCTVSDMTYVSVLCRGL